MSLLTDLADAVVGWINDGTYSAPYDEFTAIRTWKPRYERTDLESLQVSIVPSSKSVEMRTRGASDSEDIQIYVGFAKALDYSSNTAPDQMATLLEETESRLRNGRVLNRCALQRLEYTTPERIYSQEMAESHDVWFSVLMLTYRIVRN